MSRNRLVRYLNLRSLALILFYSIISLASYWAAYELRFDFNVPENHGVDRINTLTWVVGLQLMLLIASGQFNSILSYFRLPDALRLFSGLFANALILISMWYIYKGQNVPPRAVILTYFLISFLAFASFRVLMRVKSSRGIEDWLTMDSAENVIIIGAGEIGAGLCSDLMNKTRLGMRPVAFLDDDLKKVGRYVHGVLVADTVDEISTVAKLYSATKAVIAFPSASVKRMRQVAELARNAGLAVDTVPALTDLVSGRAELSQLRPIQLEDLLGRDTVDLNSDDIRNMLAGKRVLVTGAGGSIGSELVAQILSYAPAELLCIDQAEIAIFDLQQNVLKSAAAPTTKIITRVIDILNEAQLVHIFNQHRPEVIFHAAAHKHVNLMEDQPVEALHNNFIATKQLARIASQHSVERLILISSDKAINPTSVMGVSKRLAELALGAQQSASGNQTKFMAVRFGNVLGSSGSVIPIFRKQIAAGGPITVTDPDVTRFFMTVEEAVGLGLQSATQGSGGEIFVLDMGESVKIIDVARQMIALSGLRENTDIDIEFIGLQPGEKLYEEVQHLSEELKATRHARVMRFVAPQNTTFDIEQLCSELEAVMQRSDVREIKQAIQKYVPEYTPSV
ncbi:nucleoside-diphosphate sugar epimerase/dehydratase [Coraliomargarita algicola]|uniref:Nucleoside-diphosphate sugar epimerase/dehydratase n=1 Tax=Coraliomargarita algicola TaxID=3092156 RepID=A0ABZ0RLZ4_9BACT|nr:nucleoside-diphosphate sugar epimerase/dehydratase [Coraliomargarita sp. J2-16]WPJ96010.1 nucleoside-diphosphate sugar epimerase/dehydratase [Coraliomargarita sp. J2-16]